MCDLGVGVHTCVGGFNSLAYWGSKVHPSFYEINVSANNFAKNCDITRSERAHSLKLFCMYDKRIEISKNKIEWRRKNLPKVKIFSNLQVHHLILAFIIHNNILNCSSQLY